MKSKPLQIRNTTIQPGEQIALALPTPELYTCTPMHIPIHIIHGKKEGPCLLVCAGAAVREAVELLADKREALLVTMDGRAAGILTRADLLESLAR
jgi:CBS domain-containing protein